MEGLSGESLKILPNATPKILNAPKDSQIVVIGAGCFGLSTAYHLLLRGYDDITVLDRSATLPAPDAASNDINRSMYPSQKYYPTSMPRDFGKRMESRKSSHLDSKSHHLDQQYIHFSWFFCSVVRSSYADKFYAKLAKEAIASWKDQEKWGDTYDEWVNSLATIQYQDPRGVLLCLVRLHRAAVPWFFVEYQRRGQVGSLRCQPGIFCEPQLLDHDDTQVTD